MGQGAHISAATESSISGSARQSRRTPRQRRARDTAEAIVTAAELTLVEVGYSRASTNVIARRAGVSVGSLYQYFSDKDAIFRAVVKRHRERVYPAIALMLRELARPATDVVTVTLELLRRMAEANGENPELLRCIDQELGWLEHEEDPSDDVLGAVVPLLRAKVPTHRDTIDVVARLMVMTVSVLARWLVHGKPRELDTEAFVAATGRMLRGLLGPDSRATRGAS